MRKNSVFGVFCTMSCKKCDKTVFFHVFRNTLWKFRKKCEKQRFLSFLHNVLQKVWWNCVFHVFRDTLYKGRKKCEKIAFFELFARCTRFAKMRKTAFFERFARCPAKSVRKQCFSRFSRHLVQGSQEMQKKKQRFLSFLHDVLQKVW